MRAPAESPLWADYARFHRLAVTTEDVDPVYPVLRELTAQLSPADRVDAVVIYVAYYDLGSALTAFRERQAGTVLADLPLTLPCATERRAHRDRRQLARHINHAHDVAARHGSLHAFLSEPLEPADPRGSWTRLRQQVEMIHGNGRWASYKTAELLQKVAGWPVEAPDMGMAGASGPAAGLRMLGVASEDNPAALEEAGAAVTAALSAAGLPGAELATAETTLCDFHALDAGRYYVGHDIDAMQQALNRTPSELTGAAFAARSASLPVAYLGELGGWSGPDKERARIYRDRGEIVERTAH